MNDGRDQVQVVLWQCRACETLNDFDGIERALAKSECEPGYIAMLAVYECAGCGFSMEPPPMWFITPTESAPVFIEAGFRRVLMEAA